MGDGARVEPPLFTSLRGYHTGWLRGDVVAGLTVWAVLVPGALAYASIAGVSPVVGLYAAPGGAAFDVADDTYIDVERHFAAAMARDQLDGPTRMSRPHPGGVSSGSPGASGSRRTSTSSRPRDWMRSSSPYSAAWSSTGPCSTVSTGSTDARMPSKAATSESLRRPRTRIS
jgi:hypothetical protein